MRDVVNLSRLLILLAKGWDLHMSTRQEKDSMKREEFILERAALEREKYVPEEERLKVPLWVIGVAILLTWPVAWVAFNAIMAITIPMIDCGTYAYAFYSIIPPIILALVVNPILQKATQKKIPHAYLMAIYILAAIGGSAAGTHHLNPFILTGIGNALHLKGEIIYKPFLNYFPSSIMINDIEAIEAAAFGGPVNWSVWLTPSVLWSLVTVAVMLALMCIGVLLRKRWSEIDRLTYPIITPIIELTRAPEDDHFINSLYRNKLAWLGFLVGFFIVGIRMFDGSISRAGGSQLPLTYLGQTVLPSLSPTMKAVSRVRNFYFFWFWPWIVSLGYITATPILASGVFWLIIMWAILYVLCGFGVNANYGFDLNATFQFSIGASITFAIILIYLARKDIAQAWKSAFSKGKSQGTDKSEGMSYKTAFFGLICSILFLVLFMTILLKMTFWVCILWLAGVLLPAITLARVRASSGVPIGRGTDFRFDQWFISGIVGHQRIGPFNHAAMGLMSMVTPLYNGVAGTMVATQEAYKASDNLGIDKKSLIRAMIIVMAVMALVSNLQTVKYTHLLPGGLAPRGYGDKVVSQLLTPIKVALMGGRGGLLYEPLGTPVHRVAFLIGVVAISLMMYLHLNFNWWPLHPIGVLVASNYYMSGWVWLNWVIAFVIKWPIMRYGGVTTYRKLVPFFFGMLVGDQIAQFLTGFLGPIFFS